MTIHLVTASDRNYGQHTGIMLMSLFDSKGPGDDISVSILDGGILQNDKEKINCICSKYGKIPTYISIDDQIIGNAKIDGHVSIATYYRILLPQLFPHLDKILYLDSDLIVADSIHDLWETNISEYYVAAVQDPGVPDEKYIQNLGLPDSTSYFNAGVLLINLKKWREDNITEKLIKRIQNDHHLLNSWDQDAINTELWRKTLIIEPKYNVMVHFLRPHLPSIYTKDQIDSALEHPIIVHYNSPDKPWQRLCQNKLKNYYRTYWRQSEWKDTKLVPVTFNTALKTFLFNNLSRNQILAVKKVKSHLRSWNLIK